MTIISVEMWFEIFTAFVVLALVAVAEGVHTANKQKGERRGH